MIAAFSVITVHFIYIQQLVQGCQLPSHLRIRKYKGGEVQNRGISGPTKRTGFQKNSNFTQQVYGKVRTLHHLAGSV